MTAASRGVVAAGHPVTAEAGARVLREGGNAVDAALAAMLVSWVAEPLLTGPGAGGYLLVAGAGEEPTLLDFFVAAPGREEGGGRDEAAREDAAQRLEAAPPMPLASRPDGPPELKRVDVSFGDAIQPFHVGAASCGAYGNPAGIDAAARRWGTVPLADLAAPAAGLALRGVPLNRQQAYIFEILAPILYGSRQAREVFAPRGSVLREGERFRSPELAATIDRLGREGAAPFYTGDIAAAVLEHLERRGGVLTAADLAAYEAVPREPARTAYRGRDVLTNPPPSAGGTLLAMAMRDLDEADSGPPALADVIAVMERAQARRTPEFLERLGSTTHIAVVDADGRACSVTCTNGEGAGLVVPGTGIHVNNIMGEEDLSPLGFHRAPPGTRMPSMMAPTAVLGTGGVELVLGSAGSNRIRSAILQTIVGVVDHGLDVRAAVEAPRAHFEAGTVYVEPGVPLDELEAAGRAVVAFRGPNLFFGGVQAVQRDPATGRLSGAGDPRRGGAVVVA